MSDKEEQLLSDELKKQVKEHLTACCNKNHLPHVQKYIASEQGMETAESTLFSMCARDGIAVQTALSQFEIELSNQEYTETEDGESDL